MCQIARIQIGRRNRLKQKLQRNSRQRPWRHSRRRRGQPDPRSAVARSARAVSSGARPRACLLQCFIPERACVRACALYILFLYLYYDQRRLARDAHHRGHLHRARRCISAALLSILIATVAAPKPLSTFTTLTPGAQLLRDVSSDDKP